MIRHPFTHISVEMMKQSPSQIAEYSLASCKVPISILLSPICSLCHKKTLLDSFLLKKVINVITLIIKQITKVCKC